MDNQITVNDFSDLQIIDEIRKGTNSLYRILIKRYNQRLYRTALSFNINDDDCDDILQQTYILAFKKLDQFRGDALFSTWLTKILINECLMFKRKGKNEIRKKENFKLVTSQIVEHQTPEYAYMQNEMKNILEDAIKELPEKYRQVFILREVEEVNVKETSAVLGITETNVKIRLHRAKTLLKKKLSKKINYKEAFTIGNKRCDNIADKVINRIILK